ncbi:hypothetical protein Hanom_Chr01g00010121 [Helianthus anomalus]
MGVVRMWALWYNRIKFKKTHKNVIGQKKAWKQVIGQNLLLDGVELTTLQPKVTKKAPM